MSVQPAAVSLVIRNAGPEVPYLPQCRLTRSDSEHSGKAPELRGARLSVQRGDGPALYSIKDPDSVLCVTMDRYYTRHSSAFAGEADEPVLSHLMMGVYTSGCAEAVCYAGKTCALDV